jgi:ribosome-binding ATPase YchF (GTP1/OBG family)
MDLWLADIVERNWESVERTSRSPEFDMEDALADMLTGFGATEYDVGVVLRSVDYPEDPKKWDDADREALAREMRAQTKPFVVSANKADVAPADMLEPLLELDKPVVPTTADGELALRRAVEAGVVEYDPGDEAFDVDGDVSDQQREGLERIREVMAAYGGTGVQQSLDAAVYDLLDHVTVYPVQDQSKWTDGQGNVLPDAFLLPRGSTPRDLAYAVHSDIGDGYLHAVDAREGRRISDDHELAEGDVVKIVSTAN